MTQTTSASSDLGLQFDRFEALLEDWHDQLSQFSAHLSSSDLAKLARRWDAMRQNLDTIFLHYGRSPSSLSAVMDGLPPLRDLTQAEMDMTLEALIMAKKALQNFAAESQQRLPLLEQALNANEKPERMRRCIDRMRAIDDAFQPRLQSLKAYVDIFGLATNGKQNFLQATQAIIDLTQRIEAMRNANDHLEGQKLEMSHWLEEAKARARRQPSTPPPSPWALGQAGQTMTSLPNDGDKALESLFTSREKLREARRYLETLLSAKENAR